MMTTTPTINEGPARFEYQGVFRDKDRHWHGIYSRLPLTRHVRLYVDPLWTKEQVEEYAANLEVTWTSRHGAPAGRWGQPWQATAKALKGEA